MCVELRICQDFYFNQLKIDFQNPIFWFENGKNTKTYKENVLQILSDVWFVTGLANNMTNISITRVLDAVEIANTAARLRKALSLSIEIFSAE